MPTALLLVLATLLILGAATTVGVVVAAACGARRWDWSLPAVGFTVLMAALVVAPAMPGRSIAPLAALACVVVAALPVLMARPELRPPTGGLLAGLPTVAALCLPFLANARIGLLGVSFNNDTAAHLWLASTMQSAAVAEVTPPLDYYPLGPHGIVAGLQTLGVRGDLALTALIVAVPVLTALAVQQLLNDSPWALRAVAMMLTALPFLGASYVAQGAFKESIMAMLLVAFAAALSVASQSERLARFVPAGFLAAGSVMTYSYFGLAWPVAGAMLCAAVWLIVSIHQTTIAATVTRLATAFPAVLLAICVSILLLAPQLPRVQAYWNLNASRDAAIAESDIGNLAGPISPREALGVWWNADFRFASLHPTITDLGTLLVLALLFVSVVLLLRAGRWQLPAVAGGAGVLAALSAVADQSPYTTAKAYAIASAFVFPIIAGTATTSVQSVKATSRMSLWHGAYAVAAATGAALALWSTGLALRGAQVGPTAHVDDLRALRPYTKGQQTLYVGVNDFLIWELAGTPVTQPLLGGLNVRIRAAKAWEYGDAFDIDSVTPAQLDDYVFVVVPRISTDSAMPPNFKRVRVSGVYELWRRTGPTQARSILNEGPAGAAVLDCSTREGRRLSEQRGFAVVSGPIVTAPLTPIFARQQAAPELDLSPGTWDLSLRYESPRPLELVGPGIQTQLPASLERAGSIWPAGSIKVDREGSVRFEIDPAVEELAVDAQSVVQLHELVAKRRQPARAIPLSAACGRWVDWYRLAGNEPPALPRSTP